MWADSFPRRQGFGGQRLGCNDTCGPIAQSVEQLAFNQWVGGSNPPRLSFFPTQTWLRQDLCDGLGAAAPRDPDVSVIRFFLHKFFPTQTWLRQDVRDGLGAAVVFLYDCVALLNRRRRSLSEAHRQLCYEKVYEGYRQRNNTDEGDACRIGASAQE